MKKLLFISVLLLTPQLFAAKLNGFSCKVSQGLIGGVTQDVELIAQPEGNYMLINKDMKLGNTDYNIYIYYDGSYSAINVFNKKQESDVKKYFNTDSEVEVGKLFSLNIYTRDVDPTLQSLGIYCKGN